MIRRTGELNCTLRLIPFKVEIEKSKGTSGGWAVLYETPKQDVNALKAGDPSHYRAYVGPPARYGLLTQLQLSLLFALGLEETDTVLDFGCGSLRLGRCLIPFLSPGHYFGIEPNDWLIEDAVRFETGNSLLETKRPSFDTNDQFDCGAFSRTFDFIVAQSIITHSGADNTARLFASAASALAPDGIFILSYIKAGPAAPVPEAPWTYPANVRYPEHWLVDQAERNGLVWKELDWFHPGAVWAAMARDPRRLPASNEILGCGGRPAERWRSPEKA
ncbi:methyltransferase domain-containing protein [Maricaulis sp. CAU 1757]